MIQFDTAGTGSEFQQDASFMVRPCNESSSVLNSSTSSRKNPGIGIPKVSDPEDELECIPDAKRSRKSEPQTEVLRVIPVFQEDHANIIEDRHPVSHIQPQNTSDLWDRINRVMSRVRDNQNRTRSIGRLN